MDLPDPVVSRSLVAAEAAPCLVLVVEDDDDCRRLLARLLAKAGYAVVEAVDGLDGLERVVEYRPAIVVSDVSMPRMDGLEFVRRLRAMELPWYPYIVLLTADCDQQSGLDAGADDFVTKPVRRQNVLPRLRAAKRIVDLQEMLRRQNAQLAEVAILLERQAATDPLTGLLNRRAFFERARHEWERALGEDLPLTCLILDIDHFKRVNDTYGHPAGDQVIRTLAEKLLRHLRASDVLCRYGGEEFCALLLNTDIEQAFPLIERFRRLVSEVSIPEIGEAFRFTISCGLAARNLESINEESLIDRADQALLLAKRTGRNRVVCSGDLDPAHEILVEGYISAGHDDRPRESSLSIPYQVVNTLLTAMRHRDPSLVDHMRQVARTCGEFARHLGLAPDQRTQLEVAALLHDIGKLGLPDELLSKTGRLSDEDFARLQRHREMTVDILSSCFTNRRLVDIVKFSDCWYNGSHGQRSGESIPIEARILAIASLFDDIQSGRGWWEPADEPDALVLLESLGGSQLDPGLAAAFVAMRKAALPAEMRQPAPLPDTFVGPMGDSTNCPAGG